MESHSTGGDRAWKHDHYLKNVLYCGDCGSRLYYVVAKGRFGYFRCVGRNTRRKPCGQSGYIPAKDLESAVEPIYERVRIPPELRKGVEMALKQEVAERERHRAEATVFLGRRLKQMANEREKLLKAYYADAIDVETLKREQARINTEVEEAEAQLSREGAKLKKAAEIIQLALNLAKSCPDAYLRAQPDVRKLWNQAFFRKILMRSGPYAQAEAFYEEPFASLLDSQEGVGSHKSTIVEVAGIEPAGGAASAARRVRWHRAWRGCDTQWC
jgi:site-specific DNA recombinase